MRIALFSLTGFANEVLPALVGAGYKPFFLLTRREIGPYPYYPIPFIGEVAARHDVPWSAEERDEEQARGCDLLLVATYHRLIPETLYGSCRYAVNLHPSLLPEYRGPVPFYWVLKNGEPETGVTAHALSDRADAGDIYAQARCPIPAGETEGNLRHRLASLAGRVAVDLARKVEGGDMVGVPQDETRATYYPRPERSPT